MKNLIAILIMALGLSTGFADDDVKATTYVVGMTGVT